MTVSRQGDTLYLQLPELEPFELAATSETELFMKNQIWKDSFIKDSDGRAIKFINQQPRGITRELPRLYVQRRGCIPTGTPPQRSVNNHPARVRNCTVCLLITCAASLSAAEPFLPDIPKLWDDAAMASLELPLANAAWSPRHVSSEYYYRIPVAPIYLSYPIYHPDREPAGYFEKLQAVEPEIVWDDKDRRPPLETEADWIAAGQLSFEAPAAFGNGHIAPNNAPDLAVRDAGWYRENDVPVTAEGVMPYLRYVVRTKGKVEVGAGSCAMCHTRVMPDGVTIIGAQGNFPIDRVLSRGLQRPEANLAVYLRIHQMRHTTPWLDPDPDDHHVAESLRTFSAHRTETPPGAIARHGSPSTLPIQVPDLIGIRERRYLDRTGLQRHREIGDLMRYSALNQGMDLFASYNGFIPAADDRRTLPDPVKVRPGRQSDEQRYALARFIYALQAAPNPHPFDERVARGKDVFHAEGCAKCHDPDHGYTNNKLIAAPGFTVPDDHPERANILNRRVGTDGTLALHTRRGTGFYKVPSLLGVWYRGPFEHNGSIATLEDWFDPRRLDDDYVPTGWKGPPGTSTRAVPGHEFGLDLTNDERAALIAFLRTL